MFRSVLSALRDFSAAPDIALDLGTAFTRLHIAGRGLLVEIPSLVPATTLLTPPLGAGAREPLRADLDALAEDGRRPLQGGVVKDIAGAAALLSPLLRDARGGRSGRPRVLACVPASATRGERSALTDAIRAAGASAVALAPEALAAAIGGGLDVASPYAQLLVDIGEGLTETAVIRSGRLLATSSLQTACGDLRVGLCDAISRRLGVTLAPAAAERVLRTMLGADEDAPTCVATGIEAISRKPQAVTISRAEVTDAIAAPLHAILDHVVGVVRDLPDAIACEVIETGLCFTGGGACLPGLRRFLAAATRLDVKTPPAPLHAVVNGAAKMLAAADATGLFEA